MKRSEASNWGGLWNVHRSIHFSVGNLTIIASFFLSSLRRPGTFGFWGTHQIMSPQSLLVSGLCPSRCCTSACLLCIRTQLCCRLNRLFSTNEDIAPISCHLLAQRSNDHTSILDYVSHTFLHNAPAENAPFCATNCQNLFIFVRCPVQRLWCSLLSRTWCEKDCSTERQ